MYRASHTIIHTQTHPAVGSFPQTAQVRRLRAQLKAGAIDTPTYEKLVDQQIALAIGIQVRVL